LPGFFYPAIFLSFSITSSDYAVTIPKGLRVRHWPRVKSGNSTGVLFWAMDFSLKAITALMVAPS